METVLETVGTGVLVVDAEGTVTALNAAACRLLDIDARPCGAAREVVDGPRPRARSTRWPSACCRDAPPARSARSQLPSRGRDRHLAVTVVPLPGPPGSPPGAVLVLDDLTPLMRAQKVAAWGEVARKLAHEIKNPLTPIQLSAQRIRKAYLKVVARFREGDERVHHRHRPGGRRPQEPGGRVRAVRAPAGGEPGARRRSTT